MIKQIDNKLFLSLLKNNINNYITNEVNIEWLEYNKLVYSVDYSFYLYDNNIIFIILKQPLIKSDKKILHKLLSNKINISSNHSPILIEDISEKEVLKYLNDFIVYLLRDKNTMGLRDFSLGYDIENKELVYNCFKQYDIKEWASFLTESTDTETIWKNYKSKIRYEVNKSKKQGLIIKEITTKSDILDALKVKNEARLKDGIALMSFSRWEENINFYIKSNSFIPIIVWKDDIVVATAILSYYGTVMSWGGLAVSNYARENHLNAMHYLNWWAIEKSNELGLKYFDTVGYNPNNRNKREDGIYIFKKRLSNIDKRYYIINFTKKKYIFFTNMFNYLKNIFIK